MTSKLYGVLSQTNPAYSGSLLAEMEDLYQGGYRILAKSNRYLTKMVGEHDLRFTERCQVTSYQPYMGQVIDQFASALFGQPLDVKPAADADNPDSPGELPDPLIYREFAKDCDRKGSTFLELMKAVLITALKKRTALIQVDAPATDATPATKAEEDARFYAFEVPVEQLIDWEEDKSGLVWAILHQTDVPRMDPDSSRDTAIETFTVWEMVDGFAAYKRYRIQYNAANGPKPISHTPVPLVEEGVTSFTRIPILRLVLPVGLWVGGMIGPLAREHFQRRSALIGSQNRSLCAIPWIKRGTEIGSEGGALPSETQQNPNRGANPVGTFNTQGWVEIGSDDGVGFAEPQGHCYELVNAQLRELKDTMFQVCHQMAASITGGSSTALGRSGLSKQKDSESTAMVLGELGSRIRSFGVLIYRTISEARGEDVVWNASGLDKYEREDRADVLKESVSMELVTIPSVTFKKHYKFDIARRLLGAGMNPATLDQIKKEIEDGVDEEIELGELMKETAAQESQRSPLDPKVPHIQGAPPAPTPGSAAPSVQQPKGETGQPILAETAHLQTGQHVPAQIIYDQLKDDYDEKDIQWVLQIPWIGPVEVPLGSVDFSNKDNWQASKDQAHVDHFVDLISNQGFSKPVILVNNLTSDEKMIVVDGHHRALAFEQLDQPMMAYVGQVGSESGPWDFLHRAQKGRKESAQGSAQSSAQSSNQTSAQTSRQTSAQTSRQTGRQVSGQKK